ncbi:MAG: hypothetical protein U0269_31255, partial [Polyangiales bacterium]
MRTTARALLLLALTSCTSPASPGADSSLDTSAPTLDAARESATPPDDAAHSPDAVAEDRSSPDAQPTIDAESPSDSALTADASDSAAAPDADAMAARDAALDASPDSAAPMWIAGPLVFSPLPPRSEQLPLPGGGQGDPVFTSNNPEIFQGDGLLF